MIQLRSVKPEAVTVVVKYTPIPVIAKPTPVSIVVTGGSIADNRPDGISIVAYGLLIGALLALYNFLKITRGKRERKFTR